MTHNNNNGDLDNHRPEPRPSVFPGGPVVGLVVLALGLVGAVGLVLLAFLAVRGFLKGLIGPML